MKVKVKEEAGKRKKVKLCNNTVQIFTEIVLETENQIKEELKRSQGREEKLIISYLMLKGECYISFAVNISLRELLCPELERAEKQENDLMNSFRMSRVRELELLRNEIEKQNQGSDSIKQKYHEKDPEWVRIACGINNSIVIKRQKKIVALENMTDDDLKKRVYSKMDETAAEIRALIPKQTTFDILYSDVMYSVEQKKFNMPCQPDLFSVSADMQIDFSKLEDPIDYFFQLIQKSDNEKLEKLKMRVEQIFS
jgi:hypothetical protein